MLCDALHVPYLRCHLFSLRVVADKGHTYTGTSGGMMVNFITREKLVFLSVGRLKFLYAHGSTALVDKTTNASIAPGSIPNNRVHVHVAHAHVHVHEGALRKTTKQMGVTLVGQIHKCKGFSFAKGIRMSLPCNISNRAIKILFRVFVDRGGKKHVKSVGGIKYPMTIRDDFSRYTWMYFISHKSDAADLC